MNRENIKVGVIGVGHLGKHHARIYSSLPGVTLVGVADQNLERGRLIGEQHQVSVYSDYLHLLEYVDAVSVAVPTSLHGEVVQQCLNQGIHVLVEKPIASTVEEGRDMVALAREKRVRLQVGHVERFNPVLDSVRPVLDRPEFIQCNRLAPYQPRGTDVDVVLDLMIHDLDIVLSWGLGPVTKVNAFGASVMSKHNDFVSARIEFGSGCIAEFIASRVSTSRLRNLCVFQPNLYVSADYQTRRGLLCRKVQPELGSGRVVEESFEGGTEDALTREVDAFLQSIHQGVHLGVSGEEGLNALELAFDVIAGIKQNGNQVEERKPAARAVSIGLS